MNIPSSWAMQIAGVDRLRFNEAVAAGLYPCAPPTEARKTRWFGTHDVIALCAFGQLLRSGITPRVAGDVACSIVLQLKTHGDGLEDVVVGWTVDGMRFTGPYFGAGNDQGRPYVDPTGPEWAMVLRFNITQLGKEAFRRYHELHQADGFDRNAEEEA